MEPDWGATGRVLGSIAAILGLAFVAMEIYLRFRKIAHPGAGAQFVTRAELDTQTVALNVSLGKVDSDLKAEMKSVETRLTAKVETVSQYTHDRHHELLTALNTMNVNHERAKVEMYVKMREIMDAAVKPLLEKEEQRAQAYARIEAQLIAGRNNKT